MAFRPLAVMVSGREREKRGRSMDWRRKVTIKAGSCVSDLYLVRKL